MHPDLDPYQRVGAQWLASQRTALLCDPPGLGKTPQSVTAADLTGAKNVLVVVPGIGRLQWVSEFGRWQQRERSIEPMLTTKDAPDSDVVVTSYSMLTQPASVKYLLSRKWDAIIADECFPANTQIETVNGPMAIGDIYNNGIYPVVVAYDTVRKHVVYRRVTRIIRRPLKKRLIRIRHQLGEFVCTEDHKIWANDAYRPGSDIRGADLCVLLPNVPLLPGEYNPFLRSRVLIAEQVSDGGRSQSSQPETYSNGDSHLQGVRARVHDPVARSTNGSDMQSQLHWHLREQGQDRHTDKGRRKARLWAAPLRIVWQGVLGQSRRQTLLWSRVFGAVARSAQAYVGRVSGVGSEAVLKGTYRKTFISRASQEPWFGSEASILQSGRVRKAVRAIKGKNLFSPRRQRSGHEAATSDSRRDWVSYGIRDRAYKPAQGPIRVTAALLQGGPSDSGDENSHRSGWQYAQDPEMAVPGPAKDRNTRVSRVVSVEVLEPGDRSGLERGSDEDQFVYDLEVEDVHNYFANGVLVSNCHKMKGPASLCTAVMYGADCSGDAGLASRTQLLWGLSGTPMKNHAGELWSHCRAMFPDVAQGRSYQQWVDRYCRSYGGVVRSTNPHHEQELISLIKPHILRREYRDVTAELPPLRFSQVVVRPDKLGPPPTDAVEGIAIVKAAIAEAYRLKSPEAVAAILEAEAMHLATLRKWTGISKSAAVADYVKEMFDGGLDKIVLFAVHRDVIAVLEKALPGAVSIHGGTSPREAQRHVDGFEGRLADHKPKVLILQLEKGAEVLNLVSCATVGFAETGWVPADITQAAKRCHRRGQTRPVTAYLFSLAGSVDEDVDNTLVRKLRDTSRFEDAVTTRS